jgi:cell fate (sporulation/competence/biofilm development) regulator YlbF (YheA/YmcA/DUF963 family)
VEKCDTIAMGGGNMGTFDMTEILLDAYQLADQINQSKEVQNYLFLQKQVKESAEAQKLMQEFQKAKQLYEEAQRFGIFHPNYHEAKERGEIVQQKLRSHPILGAYLLAEEKIDQLLYQVSSMIARSVSDSIKVPVNDAKRSIKEGKCRGSRSTATMNTSF